MVGRYHVLGRIGQSAVGALHLARLEGPQGFQRWAALRIVDKERAADPKFYKEFFERAGLGASLLHPNVAALFDVGETEGTLWLATEYLQGERVEEIIERIHLAGTAVSWDLAARIVADAAEGLFALHEHKRPDGTPIGLLHGDVAPHNLLVTYAGETKVKGAFEPRTHGTLDRRKLPYAAPEQIWSEEVDARTDVFALGVILWELCAATRLFARGSDDETRAMVEAGVVPSLCDEVPGFPPEIDSLVRRALAHDKEDRFSSARELSRALEAAIVARGVLTRADDVGSYMKTLFADRFHEREAEIQDAAQVTEVFLKTKRRLTIPKTTDDTSGLVDLSVHDAESEPTVLSDSDELPTTMHRMSAMPDDGSDADLTAEDPDLATTVEKPPRSKALPPAELGAPEPITDEVTAHEPITKDLPTQVKRSFASIPESSERRAPPVQRISAPPPRGTPHSVTPLPSISTPPPPTRSVPPPPVTAPMPAHFASNPPPPSAVATVPPFAFHPQAAPQAEPRRGHAALAGVVVALVLFGGFIIAMQSRAEPNEIAATPPPRTATAAPTPPPPPATSATSVAVIAPPIPTIRDVKATDLPVSTSKKPTPRTTVVVRPPPPPTNEPAKTGQLTVICTPACDQVMDGGKSLGPTPIFKRTVTAGTHHLTLRGEDGTKKSVTVEVAEGETAVVKQPM